MDIKKKVNGIGRAGKIVSIVLIALMGAACFFLLTAGIICSAIGKETVEFGVKADFDLKIGKSAIGEGFGKITDAVIDRANEELNDRLPEGSEPVEMTIGKTDEGVTAEGGTGRITFSPRDLAPSLFGEFARCACLLVIFVFMLRLAEAFRTCESPFEDGIVRRMTTFAWVLLGGAVLMGVTFDSGLFKGSGVLFGGVNYSLNIVPVLIALVVLFLARIFRYGAKLQQESDETL